MVLSEAATDQQIAQWHKDGAVVIEDFLLLKRSHPSMRIIRPSTVCKAKVVMAKPWTSSRQEVLVPHTEKQFMNVDILPYQGSVAMNMISLNPEVDRTGKKVVRR